MAVVGILFPIFLLFIVIVGCFLTMRVGKKYMTIKVTHWILFIYMGVLVLATLLAPLIVKDSASIENAAQGMTDKQFSGFYEKLNTGNLSEIDSKFLIKEMTFKNYNDQQLTIETNTMNEPQIFVEKKQNSDATIEVFVYSSGLVVDGLDFSNRIKPFQFELIGNQLLIQQIYQELNVAIVGNSFPVRQFTGQSLFDHHYSSSGDSVIYLKVPKDLEMNEDNIYLYYIES